MSLVGKTTVDPKLPLPQPHDPSSTNREDKAVSIVEMMLVEALRASAADEGADHQPAKQMTSHQAEGERVGESKAEMTLVRATRALEKRLVVDLEEPKPGAG